MAMACLQGKGDVVKRVFLKTTSSDITEPVVLVTFGGCWIKKDVILFVHKSPCLSTMQEN